MPDPIFDDPRLAVWQRSLDAIGAAVRGGGWLVFDRTGFQLRAVRDAPDRPGRELVFFAQSAELTSP